MSFAKFLFSSVAALILATLFTGCTTPLQGAARDGDTLKISKLLDDGNVNINDTGSIGWTPLEFAIVNRNPDSAKVLIERGADLSGASEPRGQTPLHRAAFFNETEIVQSLIDAGADINARERIRGETPIHFAARNGSMEAVKLLLDAGADTSIVSSEGLKAEDSASKSKSHNKQAVLNLLNKSADSDPSSSRAVQVPPPEPVVIPQMNAPE